MVMTENNLVPIILLTGFLGAGKTTWLKKALKNEEFEQTAVLVNEFGEVGIDHLLVDAIAPDIVLLDSGCICCQIRGELKQAILDLLSKRHNKEVPFFNKIVIETTGLADPTQIYSTLLMDNVLRNQISLDQIVTIVDCLNGNLVHAKQPEWLAQIAAASLLIFSKSDLVAKDHQLKMRQIVAKINPIAEIATVDEKNKLSDLVRGEIVINDVEQTTHENHGNATTMAMLIDNQIDWTRFVIWLSALIHIHGDHILRVKCLLNTHENGVLLIDGVGHTLHRPQHLEKWPDTDSRSRLIFIARGLDLKQVETSFKVFVEPNDKIMNEEKA